MKNAKIQVKVVGKNEGTVNYSPASYVKNTYSESQLAFTIGTQTEVCTRDIGIQCDLIPSLSIPRCSTPVMETEAALSDISIDELNDSTYKFPEPTKDDTPSSQ